MGVHDTTACLPASYDLSQLPNLPGTQCTWQLVGNIQQGSWDLGLIDPTVPDTLSTYSSVCNATLLVQAADLVPRVIVLEANFGTEIDDYAVTISPKRADCDTGGGGSQMDCTLAVP
jgi:hypothetical protein